MYFYHQLAACFKKSINSGMHNFLRWSISVSLITLLCTISYLFWDIEIALFFHALNDTQSHDVFNIITGFGESQWYLGAGVLLFVVFRRRNRFRSYLGLFMSLSVAVSGVSADIIKYVAGRARPILYFSDKLYGFNPFHYEYEWISFPSGHATTAFSAIRNEKRNMVRRINAVRLEIVSVLKSVQVSLPKRRVLVIGRSIP